MNPYVVTLWEQPLWTINFLSPFSYVPQRPRLQRSNERVRSSAVKPNHIEY